MSSYSFGQALGSLILQKRKAAGLTQIQLAEDAFGSSAKVRRISELENGQVSSPHPRTIDPLIVALGISDSEIDACAKQSISQPDENLDRAYREARNLIDAIALQFELSKPSSTLAELDKFLRTKALEWSTLKTRIEEIDNTDTQIQHLKDSASKALSEGDFDSVDALLAQAEESFQKEKTLREIRKHADIRTTRGDARLFSGDTESALENYRAAAYFFKPFSAEEMNDLLDQKAAESYEICRRSLNPDFKISYSLLEELLENIENTQETKRLTQTHYQLSLVYRSAYETSKRNSDESKYFVDKSIIHAEQAVESQQDAQEEAYRRNSVKISLANSLADRAKETQCIADLEMAIYQIESIKESLDEDQDSRRLLKPVALNSLGAFILNYINMSEEETSLKQTEATAVLRSAIQAAEDSCDMAVWSAAKVNLGGLMATQAMQKDTSIEEQIFLRIRAISEFLGAIETFPETIFPYRFAQAQTSLADVFFAHATTIPSEASEVYLLRAIGAYEAALQIYTREFHPAQWGHLQVNIGKVIHYHSTLDWISSQKSDQEEAEKYYNSAIEVSEELGLEDLKKHAEKLKDKLVNES